MIIDHIAQYWEHLGNDKYLSYKIIYDYRVMLAVVVSRQRMQWCAYISGVPGHDHEKEKHMVRRDGTLVPEVFAKQFCKDVPEELKYSEDL
jgi:hypothetical protein